MKFFGSDDRGSTIYTVKIISDISTVILIPTLAQNQCLKHHKRH